MKVGIVTHYYNSENYGGNLQAYALCKAIRNLGYDVEQISYKRPKSKGFLRAIKRNLLKIKYGVHFYTANKLKERKKAIFSFNSTIPHSKVYEGDAIYDCASEYDVFVTGSDQVWHPNAVCDAYLLKFVPPTKIKLSYSASVAHDTLSEQAKSRYSRALADYTAISVREKSAVSLIQELTSKPVEITLDPTLLLTREDWFEIAEPSQVNEKYVFCYFLGDDKEQRRLVKKFAHKNNLKIVTLPNLLGKYRAADRGFGDYRFYGVTPNRLLSLINDAECIFTDSFHVAVFSNIFEKEHFIFPRSQYAAMGSRVYTLCELFETQERFCDTEDKLTLTYIENELAKKLEFKKESLNILKKKSLEFLEKNLKPKGLSKHLEISDLSLCSGCHACVNACPKNCISMIEDKEGFLYPSIDNSECVFCGKCVASCPILRPNKRNRSIEDLIAYGAYNKDEEIRRKSSSGGIFTLIAEKIIEQGGVVFGAAFNEDFSVSHKMVTNTHDLSRFRGSKYVQSSIGNAYAEAKGQLDSGKKVLFTGTPCQIEGLYSYLKKDYTNLYTQDIICHGVPSPKVWQSYLSQRKKEASVDNIVNAFFKDKRTGWKTYSITLKFDEDKCYTQRASADPMMRAFISNLCLRPSCHSCAFKSKTRQSDITLADYWGANKIIPKWDDDKGLSLVILNSPKGKCLFDCIKESTEYIEVDLERAISYNSSMIKSAEAAVSRDKFMEEIDKNEFDAVANKYLVTPKRSFKQKIKNIMKIILGV